MALGREVADAVIEVHGDLGPFRRDLARAIASAEALAKALARTGNEGERSFKPMSALSAQIQKSWARMDSTVRVVLTLIASAAGQMATLGSGLAGSATALASSFAFAAGALLSMVGPMAAFALAIGLAVTGWKDMVARVPELQAALSRIATNWKAQATEFTLAWQDSLTGLLTSFATQMESFNFGAPLGRAIAGITDAFNALVNGPSFRAFMEQMTTNFPAALEGLGRGFSDLLGGLMSLFAGAGPVAKQLADDFQNWANKIGGALERARESGQITALFERMRDSLLKVLDLAGSLGSTLGTLFGLGADSGNRMLDSITRIVDQFNAWMNTEAGREAMLTWFSNAERIMGSMKPLFEGLGKALGGLVTDKTIEDFGRLMSSLGGILPLLGEMLAVIDNLGILNLFAEAILAISKAIEPALPALFDLAGVVGDTLSGVIAAIAPLLRDLVVALTPAVQAFADLAKQVLPVLVPMLVEVFGALSPLLIAVADLAAGILTQLLPALGPILVGALTFLRDAFKLLGDAVGIAVSAVQDGVAQIVGFFQNLGPNIANFNQTVNQAFSDFWNGIVTQLATWGAQFMAGWNGFWGGLGSGINDIFAGIGLAISNQWNTIVASFQGFVAMFNEGWNNFWNGLATIIDVVWQTIVMAFNTQVQNIITGLTTFLIVPFTQFWTSFWNALSPTVQNALTQAWTFITTAFTTIVSTFTTFQAGIVAGWNAFWSGVGNTVSQIWGQITSNVSKYIADVQQNIASRINQIAQDWNNFWNTVFAALNAAWGRITSAVSDFTSRMQQVISGATSAISSGWNSVWSSVSSFLSSTWSTITGAVDRGINYVRTIISGAMSAVQSAWSNAWSTVTNLVSTGMSRVQQVVGDGVNRVVSFFQQLPGQIGAALGAAVSIAANIGSNIISGLIGGIRNMAGAALGAVRDVIGGAINAAKSLLGIGSPSKLFRQFGKWTGEGLSLGFSDSEDPVMTAMGKMVDAAVGVFDKSEMYVRGVDAAAGLAKGLSENKSKVKSALGNLTPAMQTAFTANASARGVDITAAGSSSASIGKQINVNEGAIVVQTKASSPDGIAATFVDSVFYDSRLEGSGV